jgi:ankyrin repeat protein
VWIAAGKSLVLPKVVRKKPLHVAISTGFHSLVELLLRHSDIGERNNTLQHALFPNKSTLVELALAYGADVGSVPFVDVLMTGERALVAAFLERGADPIKDYRFARAFHLRAKTTLGSYLDCRRSRPDLTINCRSKSTWVSANSVRKAA